MSSAITSEEHRIIVLVAEGLKNSDIAETIGATEDRVKNCLRRVYDKTGTWNRLELALWHAKEQS